MITSNQAQAAGFGTPVPVDVYSEEEALAFLAERIGWGDDAGARELGEELGWLPLALAQAAAVIAAQHLDYPTYLARLRAVPVQNYLTWVSGEPYPQGVGEAIVLALDAAATNDPTGLSRGWSPWWQCCPSLAFHARCCMRPGSRGCSARRGMRLLRILRLSMRRWGGWLGRRC